METKNISAKIPRVVKYGKKFYIHETDTTNSRFTGLHAQYLVFHHDGTFISDSENPETRAIADATYSVQKDYHHTSPYHFQIARNGQILQLIEDLQERTAHASNWQVNLSSIAICFQGNYQIQELTEAQKESAKFLVSFLQGKLPGLRMITHHYATSAEANNGIATTACPASAKSFVETLKFENNKLKMTDEQIKNFVQRQYRLAFGREETSDQAVNSWISWIKEDLAQRLVDFPSVLLSSAEGKKRKTEMLKSVGVSSQDEITFYLDDQPNGMARTFGEIFFDKN